MKKTLLVLASCTLLGTAASAQAVGHKTDDYVLGHPWQSVGIAAGIGLLLGMLISRR